jgi:NitT/TauT family transport system substrate-binding protein
MTRMRAVIVTFAVVFASIAADDARTADKMKLAVGQCGSWDSSQIELGTRIGAYARYGVELEALCTQGTGETQQAVIAGSADIGIGVGTLGAIGAFAKGAPIRIVAGSATGNADFWIVKAESPLKNIKDASRAHTIAYSSNGSSTALAAARRCRSRSRESVIAAGVDHAPPSPGAEAWMARAWTPF